MRMIQVLGTSSGSGKTTIAMALCRIFSRRGYKVAPFKAVNMSLNSVIVDGEYEIARAQWLQAKAAGTVPSKLMNPILLKPEGMGSSQVIFFGKSIGKKTIEEYYDFIMKEGRKAIREAIDALSEDYDVIVAEGAGSPAEINLTDRDLANTYVSSIYGTPSILVGDIERGGVFASLYGTISLMPRADLVRWMLINKMRGDKSMLYSGIRKIEEITGRKVLGVVPYYEMKLPGEDSFDYQHPKSLDSKIAIVRYPFMENYSDLDPLIYTDTGYNYITAENADDLSDADTIVLPGSKNVFADLEYMRRAGIDRIIERNVGRAKIIGICGGYQMLGRTITMGDTVVRGLGLLNAETYYENVKTTRSVRFRVRNSIADGSWEDGYEIHYGKVVNTGDEPMNETSYGVEGNADPRTMVFGTNIHGILGSKSIFRLITGKDIGDPDQHLISEIDRFADIVSASISMDDLFDYVEGRSA
ncbi:cobyric acid synthase [Thermoplasma sp. Kam2015]|uniref:cobyric acid synthase n=1 Tax=Thermoplasma sp. Kam2015 TaxID=2094122 RepID=UPI001F020160|nr:cobyric acid synthase [Thermoplasma sp. Kam2015]